MKSVTEHYRQTEIETAALGILSTIQKAINKKDIDLWLEVMNTQDDVAKEAMSLWFKGYIIDYPLINSQIDPVEINQIDEIIKIKCSIKLEYNGFDPIEEIHIYSIKQKSETEQWQVVWLEKAKQNFLTDDHLRIEFVYHTQDCQKTWFNKELADEFNNSADPLPGQIYARAIPRNIRFREAYPMLESASILADLMSLKVLNIAAQIYHCDPLHLLANLYNAAKSSVFVQLVRPDRNNTWSSKLYAPWYSFDEMDALRGNGDKITGNCSPVMTFFFTLLRLGGFALTDLFQIRLHNQDIIVVKIGSTVYLLTSDKIIHVTPYTLFHIKNITKIYNDIWYWTNIGFTNIQESRRQAIKYFFTEKLPIFNFTFNFLSENTNFLPDELPDLPNLSSTNDLTRLNNEIKKQIIRNSKTYPYSPFTWAKYAYQTLWVAKPEAYAACSLQSPLINNALNSWNTVDDVLAELRQYLAASIYLEQDRIMIADQVIRHRKGDAKSFALLMFTYLKLKQKKDCFILLSECNAYCIYKLESAYRILEMNTLKYKKNINNEKKILAFDEKISIFNIEKLRLSSENKPVWFDYYILLT